MSISALLVLSAATLFSLLPGPGDISLQHILILAGLDNGRIDEPARIILVELRLPRLIITFLVGGALAQAGTLTQGFFRNPLADPGMIGISAAGALGAVIAMTLGLQTESSVTLYSAAGTVAGLLILWLLAGYQKSMTRLLLTGVALAAFFSALITVILSLEAANWQSGRRILIWLMGSFDGRGWSHVQMTAPFIVSGFLIALFLNRHLDAFQLGDETARSLGINTGRTFLVTTMAVALLNGSAVAVSGIIGFTGLMVPHITRILIGPAHSRLITASFLTGGFFMILVDAVSRAVHPLVLPPGVITSLIGGVFFIWLVKYYHIGGAAGAQG